MVTALEQGAWIIASSKCSVPARQHPASLARSLASSRIATSEGVRQSSCTCAGIPRPTRSTMPFRSRSVFSCCAANALAAALPPSSISPRSRCSLPIYVCPNSSAACIASFMARIALPVKPSVYRILPFLSAVCSHFISFERDKYSIFFLQDLSKQSHFFSTGI